MFQDCNIRTIKIYVDTTTLLITLQTCIWADSIVFSASLWGKTGISFQSVFLTFIVNNNLVQMLQYSSVLLQTIYPQITSVAPLNTAGESLSTILTQRCSFSQRRPWEWTPPLDGVQRSWGWWRTLLEEDGNAPLPPAGWCKSCIWLWRLYIRRSPSADVYSVHTSVGEGKIVWKHWECKCEIQARKVIKIKKKKNIKHIFKKWIDLSIT